MNIEKLKIMRNKIGLSQRELAKVAGVSFGTVQNLEAGKPVNMKTLEKIAGALGMPPAYFIS